MRSAVRQRRRAIAWAWAACNAFGLIGALAVLPFTGVTHWDVVAASWLIVSMQAAQSAIVQSEAWTRSAHLIDAWTVPVLACTALGALVVSEQWCVVLACIAGVSYGASTAIRSGAFLTRGDAAGFQLAMVRRTATVCAGVLVGVGVHAASEASLVVGCAGVLVADRIVRAHQRDGRPVGDASSGLAVVALGTVASLYYRNDVNWLRGATVGSSDFERWHIALLAYGVVQAVAGVAIVNHVFTRRDGMALAARRALARPLVLALGGCVAGIAVLPMLVLDLDPWFAVACGVLPALLIACVSGAAHVNGWSVIPYTAGSVSVTAMLLALWSGAGVPRALGLELVVTLSLLVGGLLLVRGRRA